MARQITSTYRLQLRPEFTFADAAALLPYLDELGVSHLYLSPVLTATKGSAHGYDVTDPTTVREELGGRPGLEALARQAHELGMGLVVDIVPNHVGVAVPHENPWWWDVLANGKGSAYAKFFDIDWDEEDRFNLPVLGSAQDVQKLEVLDGELRYYEHRYPLAQGSAEDGSPQEVHDRQHYRLVPWNTDRVGYRRFFSVNELAGLRQEDPDVFAATHAQLKSLLDDGLVDGVRVDHPDGLADPAGYLRALRELVGPDRWLVVEKILHHDEALDPVLPVDGTTGYDALREVCGVFVHPGGEEPLTELSARATGDPGDAAALAASAREAKREAASGTLRSELRRLVRSVVAETGTPVPSEELAEAVVSTIVRLDVYRTDYPSLRGKLAKAIAKARDDAPELAAAFDALAEALARGGESAVRFHQLCGPVMAKGVEDRLFYRTARLTALQEVGGAPELFGVPLDEFHIRMATRSERDPRTMTALSTHDTKRGEDVRARLALIAESPLWRRLVYFDEGMPGLPTEHADQPGYLFPSGHDFSSAAGGVTGYLLWQALWGVLPAPPPVPARMRELETALARRKDSTQDERQETALAALREEYRTASESWNRQLGELPEDLFGRVRDYALKANREAGLKTSWANPDLRFENDIDHWLNAVAHSGFGALIRLFRSELAASERANILGQKLIQLTCPGIPDVYQGTEFPEDSLVDPDNRRLVDYAARTAALAAGSVEKQQLVRAALRLRRERPDSFVGGGYWPVPAHTPHLLGFGRGPSTSAKPDVIVLATRFATSLEQQGGWQNQGLDLGDTHWQNRLGGKRWTGLVPYAELFADRPVALLADVKP
ncbi:malto-oligosyltrehalose synthase [Segniliparus rugosus]|uniref:Malto-oligosyltrehalose synthase n=1 Tax=Segniliparus rugosus (strain ATCC BAA-974 / DSM 45345 / CCUG 50838 / CIP 108380 / JCM 13579 / CDC 945) TaxID=679197 RepID=E5XMX4_SEGRC|nr:malto-oligosyltrehalose synthase [Segniliparus rugosus]EFV14300.1 malto-oligosyltrehalose synthase [Segniliparus rugosus ATCC BAA-974]